MPPSMLPEHARAEVAELVPLQQHFAKQLGDLRLGLGTAEASTTGRFYEKALRYERLVGRLENRIRVAMLTLAQNSEG